MTARTYRDVAVAALPDSDWVVAQAVPAGVPNVYSIFQERKTIEIVPVWWNATTDTPVADLQGQVVLQPIEVKRVRPTTGTGPEYALVCNATSTNSMPPLSKENLEDTHADAMYLRVVSAPAAPVGATHLRLVVEVTQ